MSAPDSIIVLIEFESFQNQVSGRSMFISKQRKADHDLRIIIGHDHLCIILFEHLSKENLQFYQIYSNYKGWMDVCNNLWPKR